MSLQEKLNSLDEIDKTRIYLRWWMSELQLSKHFELVDVTSKHFEKSGWGKPISTYPTLGVNVYNCGYPINEKLTYKWFVTTIKKGEQHMVNDYNPMYEYARRFENELSDILN